MSIYKSEITIINQTSDNIQVGTTIFHPNSGVTVWDTRGTFIPPIVFNTFINLNSNSSILNTLISSGSLEIIQDDIRLTYDQYLYVWQALVIAVSNADELNRTLSPISSRPSTKDGTPLVVQSPREGDEWVVVTHNFSDPCTWFQDSVRITNGVLTDSGDGLNFNSLHRNWVDMTSGRMHNEELWSYLQTVQDPSEPHGYLIGVTVDGEPVTAREPFSQSGGDYEIDYSNGSIKFFTSQAGKEVLASYNHATSSIFYVRTRNPGKILVIEDAEADLSADCIMNDAIVYSWWYFDPEQGQMVNGGGYSYKRVSQIFTEARGSYPTIKAVGSTDEHKLITSLSEFRMKSRGMFSDRQSVPFNYSTVRELPYGAEIRIFLKNDIPLGGEHISMTLYCTEK